MSESDSEGGAQRPALPVPPEPPSRPKHSGPPTTAAEYLRLVRQQSAALPNIFISRTPAPPCKKRRRSYVPSPIPAAPHFAKPDPQWQRDLVFWFAELQRTVASLPALETDFPRISDVEACYRLLKDPPKLSTLRRMDYVSILRILRLIDESTVIEGDKDEDDEIVTPSFLEEFRAEWMFSLLCFVQPPISGEMGSIIRSLLRKTAINRDGMVEGIHDESIPVLNVLITILGKYFRQEDVP